MYVENESLPVVINEMEKNPVTVMFFQASELFHQKYFRAWHTD